MQNPPAPILDYFIRPATIGLRFNDQTAYEQALATYGKVLQAATKPGEPVNSLAMGTGTSGKEGTEVRISLDTKYPAGQIVYWEVPTGHYNEVAAYLKGCALTPVGKEQVPDPSPLPPGHTLPPLRSVFADASGNTVGIVINPPIPVALKATTEKIGSVSSLPFLTPPVDIAIGVVMGLVLGAIGRKIFA
jgi:hypothetical protein